MLLAAADRRIGLLSDVARRLEDPRQAGKLRHKQLPLLRQRVYAVALGHEDVNDHGEQALFGLVARRLEPP